jgi:hypothetical protein
VEAEEIVAGAAEVLKAGDAVVRARDVEDPITGNMPVSATGVARERN